MPALRSFLDPISFARFIHVDAKKLKPEIREKLLAADNEAFGEFFLSKHHEIYEMDTEIHESIHYWQGMMYPYLQWYSIMTTHGLVQAFGKLLQQTTDFTNWSVYLPLLDRIVERQTFQLTIQNNKQRNGEKHIFEANEIELLENVTSLLEWQLTDATDPTDHKSYRRWLKRNPSYHKIYDFACRYTGSEEKTIRFFAPLVRAAFRTSRPLITFSKLLGFMSIEDKFMNEFLAQKEPCRWGELFDNFLKNELELEQGDLGNIESKDLHLVDYALGMTLVNTSMHPILRNDTKRWKSEVESNPALEWFLDQPFYTPKSVKEAFAEKYFPPITFVRLHNDLQSRTVTFGRPADGGYNTEFGMIVHSWLVMMGVIKKASGSTLGDRMCHHIECPYYEDNFCNGYTIPPNDFRKCKFPDFMKNSLSDMAEHPSVKRDFETKRKSKWNIITKLLSRLKQAIKPRS